MYATRNKGLNPAALGGALLINGGLIALLATLGIASQVAGPVFQPLKTRNIPLEPPPPPEPKPKTNDVKHKPTVIAQIPMTPKPLVQTHQQTVDLSITSVIPRDPIPLPLNPVGPTTDPGPATTPTPAPVLVAAEVDPRYAGDFQPPYPSREQAMQREGIVVVRVLIGPDGRVQKVEQVSATSPAFFEATRRTALSKWRFKPATRDGKPYATWKQMRLRFVLNQ